LQEDSHSACPVQVMSYMRTPERQTLASHLHECGPRPVLEALLAVSCGASVDAVLRDFGRLPPKFFKAVGADLLPVAWEPLQ
jgi:hypothetical protein